MHSGGKGRTEDSSNNGSSLYRIKVSLAHLIVTKGLEIMRIMVLDVIALL